MLIIGLLAAYMLIFPAFAAPGFRPNFLFGYFAVVELIGMTRQAQDNTDRLLIAAAIL